MEYQKDASYSSQQIRDILIGLGCLVLSFFLLMTGLKTGREKTSRKTFPIDEQALTKEKSSAPELTPMNYKIYDAPQKFTVIYPSYLNPEDFSEGEITKVVFSSVEQGITMTAEKYDGGMVPGLSIVYENMLKTRSKNGSVTYKLLKDDFFVISGYDSRGKIFYRRESIVDGFFYGIELLYPDSWKEPANRLIASFSDFPRMNSLLYSGNLIDGATTYPIALRLFVNEDDVVSGYYWYKRYKESNHTNLSGSVTDTKPLTLVMVSAKGTEVFRFVSPMGDRFNCESGLSGEWFKYENNEARLAGADPVKSFSVILK